MKRLQNFYSTTLASACGSSDNIKIYVNQLPELEEGFLVISASDSVKREIIEYNDIGTDENGNYVFANQRGLGGTTAQGHSAGEIIAMNLTAEHWEEMKGEIDNSVKKTGNEEIDGIKTFVSYPKKKSPYVAPTDNLELAPKKYVDDIVVAGSPDASETVKGLVEIATASEIDAGTQYGGTGAWLVASPLRLASSKYSTQLPTADQKAALAGTVGSPSASNPYVTKQDKDTNFVLLSGDQTIAGIKTFSSIPVLPSSNPTSDNQAVRKRYADRVLFTNWTTTSTSPGDTDKVLSTYTLSGGTLGSNGGLIIRTFISAGNEGTNFGNVKVWFGSKMLLELAISTTSTEYWIDVLLYNTTSTSQRYFYIIFYAFSGYGIQAMDITSTAFVNTDNDIIIKVTGTQAARDGIQIFHYGTFIERLNG